MSLYNAIYGLAVADALGVPFEFETRNTFNAKSMVGYGTYNLPAGTFSDDTSLTLATCDSIRHCTCIDIDDMHKRFIAWMQQGKYAVDGNVFDIGMTTQKALYQGFGERNLASNGNGSLMRIIPLAFVQNIADEQIADVSAITHAHSISKQGCIYYIHIAQQLLAGKSLRKTLSEIDFQNEYERLNYIETLSIDDVYSDGYVVHTLEAAIWALLMTNNYKDCVLMCVNMGGDTDTVAAVAGALAGIVYGYDGIPQEWIKKLRGRKIIEACLF